MTVPGGRTALARIAGGGRVAPGHGRATVAAAMPFLCLYGPRCRFGLLLAVLALLGQALGPAAPVPAAARGLALSAPPVGDMPICPAGATP